VRERLRLAGDADARTRDSNQASDPVRAHCGEDQGHGVGKEGRGLPVTPARAEAADNRVAALDHLPHELGVAGVARDESHPGTVGQARPAAGQGTNLVAAREQLVHHGAPDEPGGAEDGDGLVRQGEDQPWGQLVASDMVPAQGLEP